MMAKCYRPRSADAAPGTAAGLSGGDFSPDSIYFDVWIDYHPPFISIDRMRCIGKIVTRASCIESL